MSNYVDYEYYNINYDGNNIPSKIFDEYANRASSIVKGRIFNRDISLFETDVKNATCSVAEILYNQYLIKERIKNIASGTEKVLSSEKIDDYSRNFSNVSVTDLQKLGSKDYINSLIEDELQNYLLYTGLLYCGGF